MSRGIAARALMRTGEANARLLVRRERKQDADLFQLVETCHPLLQPPLQILHRKQLPSSPCADSNFFASSPRLLNSNIFQLQVALEVFRGAPMSNFSDLLEFAQCKVHFDDPPYIPVH